MSELHALADTERLVDAGELPASVRRIPVDFDPTAEGVLMKHQAEWISLHAPFKVSEKGRRTGITFAEALDDTIIAASRPNAGGDNVYYVGDTKEKGLEFIGYVASFARVISRAQQQGVSGIEQFLFEDADEHGNTRHITSYRVRFASGHQVAALSSRPANIRGLQGKVVIDEAAYHPDVQGVLDASTALLIWGGEIRVISTHNGKRNPYNQLVNDVRDGRYGREARIHRVEFDEAVANGLFERVAYMRGWEPTLERKKAWYQRIRDLYGPRKAAMREELDVIPRDSGGVCIPGVWIESAMREARPVERIVLDDDFVAHTEGDRRQWASAWIKHHLMPLIGRLDRDQRHVFGMDFARHRDFSDIAPVAIGQRLERRVPWVIEMQNVPTRQQEQILWAMIDALPRFGGGAMDATGPGQTLAEYTADRYGHGVIHQVVLNRPWYGEHMPRMIQGFEDGIYDIPRDADLEGDLRAVEEIDGIPMVPAVRRKDLKDPELYRHGDFAIALALAHYASTADAHVYDYHRVPLRPSRRDRDDDFRRVRTTGGFRRGAI